MSVQSTKLCRKSGWMASGSILGVAAAGLLAAGSAQAHVPNNNLDRNQAPTLAAPDAVNGIGLIYTDFGPLGGGICTGTLINPRAVLFAAHCVNDAPEGAYGSANGVPTAVSFKGDAFDGLLNWITGGYQTNYADQTYNVSRVFYDPRSLQQPVGNFFEADVALAVLDAPTRGVPTWAMLFSPLTGEENLHVTVGGYGNTGTGTTGQSQGVDFRRRAGENMIGALASLDDIDLFLFGNGSQSGLGQKLYVVDFDDPNGTSPFDFNIFGDDVALPNEGLTAQGDSGGPLILDQAFGKPVIAGVLSLGSRFFAAQPSSSYGTIAGYQPLYLFTDYIVANNPYKYVVANAGDGDWFDTSRWTQAVDPNYQIIQDGALVNGLPTTPAEGVGSVGGEFGSICFFDDCVDAAELAEFNDGMGSATAADTQLTGRQTGSNAGRVDRGALVQGGTTAMVSSEIISEIRPAAILTAPGATAGFEFIPGGPGSTNFAPNNSDGSVAAGTRPVYYDVTLANAGRTSLNGTATIDRLTIGASGAVLDIGSSGTLNSIIDATVTAGQLNVDGRFNTFEMLLLGGMLSGSGVIDPTVLTSIMGSIAPGGQGTVGTLTLQGDLVLTSGSRLFIDIDGPNSDRLVVLADGAEGTLGEASIGGLLGLNPVSRPTFGSVYTVLTAAGGIAGEFNAVTDLPGILFPTVSYTDTSVLVEVEAGLFGAVVDQESDAQVSVAGLLDRARQGSYSALSSLYGEVDVLVNPALGVALETLAPYSTRSALTLGAIQTETQIDLVSSRISLRRGSDAPQGLSVIGGVEVASLNADMVPDAVDKYLAAQDAAAAVNPWTSDWKSGMAGFLAVGVANGEASQLQNVLLDGEDRQLSLYVAGGLERTVDNLTLGASVAYSDGEAEYTVSQTDTRQYQAAVYGSLQLPRNLFVGGHASYGRIEMDSERATQIGTTRFRAEGETEGDIISGGAEFGAHIARGGLNITPSIGVDSYQVSLDGYSETGSVIALAVEDVDYASTQAFVGVRFDGVIERPNFVMRPALSARGVMEVSGNENGVAAAFSTGGAPTTFFAASRDEEWGEVAGSVMFDRDGADLTLRAASMIGRDDVDYQTYTATVSMRF